MRAFLILVFAGLVALGAGSLGYQAGLMSGAGANTAQVVYFAGFHPFGGFLFFLFFIGLLLIAFRPRRGPWGRHGMTGGPGHWGGGSGRWGGPGYWAGGPTGDATDPRRSWIADAHRRLHEEEARSAGPTAGGTPTGAATGTPAGTATPDAGSGGPTSS